GLLRPPSRSATRRTSLFDALRRRLSSYHLRRRSRSALLHAVDIRCARSIRYEPELNPAVKVRVTRIVRTGVAKGTHRDASRVDALLVDQVVACVVRASQRDSDSLGRIAMTIDHHG